MSVGQNLVQVSKIGLVVCLHETKWKGKKDIKFMGINNGTQDDRIEVGIRIDKDLNGEFVDFKRIIDKMISIKLVLGKEIINIIYASQVGKVKKELGKHDRINSNNSQERIFIGRDSKTNVGKDSGRYMRIHIGYKFGERDKVKMQSKNLQ